MKLRPVDFARQAGVTKQAISAKIKNQTLIVDAAGFLDTDNPINSAYISDPGRRPRKPVVLSFPAAIAATTANGEPAPRATAAPPLPTTDAEMAAAAGVPAAELLNYTLRDVVLKFNGIYNLEKHARTLRDIMMSADKEQRMAERAGRLIPKDLVTGRIFPYLKMMAKQIFEYPESAADNIIALVLSDGPESRAAIIAMMRDGLSRIVAESKEQAVGELNSLRSRHDPAEMPEGMDIEGATGE